jgi:hypothetical protein
MDGVEALDWVAVSQALATPTIAVVGILIAWGQLRLAKIRLQHDLYDRRHKIFSAARKLIAQVCTEGTARDNEVFEFLRSTDDAIFLLGRSVADYMEELRKKAFQLDFLRKQIAIQPPVPNRSKFIDEERDALIWFTAQFEVLVARFKPFLQLGPALLFSKG